MGDDCGKTKSVEVAREHAFVSCHVALTQKGSQTNNVETAIHHLQANIYSFMQLKDYGTYNVEKLS
jgi:hypothetical protein